MAILDVRIGLKHEPLRPVTPLFILLCEKDPKNVFDGLVMLQRDEKLDGSLTDIASAPRAAGVLLEAVWHGQMNHGIAYKPRKHCVEHCRVSTTSLDPGAAGDTLPEILGGRYHLSALDATLILRGETFGLRQIGQ